MIQLAHYSGNLLADGSLLPMDGDTLPDGSVPLRFTPSLPLYPASFAPSSQKTCLQRAPPSNVAEGGTPPGGYPIHLSRPARPSFIVTNLQFQEKAVHNQSETIF